VAGVPLSATDVLPPGSHRERVEALHEFYGQAGLPGTRRISKDSWRLGDALDLPDTISHEGVSAILRGEGVPRWSKVECLVRILAAQAVGRPNVEATVQRFHMLWLSAVGVGSALAAPVEVQGLAAPQIQPTATTAENEEGPSQPTWGDWEVLRQRADAGDSSAVSQLDKLYAELDDVEGLRQRAEVGDEYAARRLADLLAERGDAEGLRQLADAGDDYATDLLLPLLGKRAKAGDGAASRQLAELLANRGDVEGLRQWANAGYGAAARSRSAMLAERGDWLGLHQLAEAGDLYAARSLDGRQLGR
jgi:hypothetical protein